MVDMNEKPKTGEILYAKADEDVVVVRVVGRGNHELSHTLKILVKELNRKDYSPFYIMNLEKCVSLDSTFLGSMASTAIHQTACRKDRALVVQANTTTDRQMRTLGLHYLMDIHKIPNGNQHPVPEDFKTAQTPDPPSNLERIVHMIDAHESLMDLSSGNEIQFRSVLDSLQKSLERETGEQAG